MDDDSDPVGWAAEVEDCSKSSSIDELESLFQWREDFGRRHIRCVPPVKHKICRHCLLDSDEKYLRKIDYYKPSKQGATVGRMNVVLY